MCTAHRSARFGESLARWDNYIEIDTNLKDAWGIPALRISMTHGDNEAALMEDAAATAAEMLEAAGAKDIKMQARVEMPGMAIHELGTARMGNDPKKSVLNAFNQIARREKSVRDGRRELRVVRLPEPDAHDDGDHRSRLRSPDRPLPQKRRLIQ